MKKHMFLVGLKKDYKKLHDQIDAHYVSQGLYQVEENEYNDEDYLQKLQKNLSPSRKMTQDPEFLDEQDKFYDINQIDPRDPDHVQLYSYVPQFK